MAQDPKKLKWKKECPYGLSASQFGMALGFSGRIVDYVDYLRNIVGSELEFTGNASTSHGIATEPKARALYEFLTGSAVSEGGFFLTEDRLLGCSPDGRIFHCSGESPCRDLPGHITCNDESTMPPAVVGVKIPFRSKWKPQTNSGTSSTCGLLQKKCRLLEIKSPFYALYDGSKPAYQPFGIPLHYLCQMQGQMAIANADECDFFVYLDRPACQVVAWRVWRCGEFWEWAGPKLRRVAEWVRCGPPQWLDRRFEFEPFDFGRIRVEPLIFPYDITLNTPIHDPRRFPFFEQFSSPYKQTAHATSHDGILRGLTSAVTRFLFYADVDGDHVTGNTTSNDNNDDVLWCSLPAAAAGLAWNSLADTDVAGPCGALAVVRPFDFNDNYVMCVAHGMAGVPGACNNVGKRKESVMAMLKEDGTHHRTFKVRYFQQDFFHSLETLELSLTEAVDDADRVPATAVNNAIIVDKLLVDGQVALSVDERRELSVYSIDSVVIVDELTFLSRAASVESYSYL